jgi:hypothetical protein
MITSSSPSRPLRRPHRQPRCSRLSLIVLAGAGVALANCDRSDLIEVLGQTRPADGPGDSGLTSIPFTVFADDVGDKAGGERHVLFKSREAYASFFGHAPPAAVDFAHDWAIFYAAGTKPTGGYTARVISIGTRPVANESLLQVVTNLESPGPSCAVSSGVTAPQVLVKIAAPAPVFNVDFARADTTRDCGGTPTNPCAALSCPAGSDCVVTQSQPPQAMCVPVVTDPCATVRCAAGTHCEARQVQCVRAPCPPIAMCVKDVAEVRCGGIAGRPCPGGGTCADDPSDSCDPANGGADCGGICKCLKNAMCTDGKVFDSSPAVCACVAKK